MNTEWENRSACLRMYAQVHSPALRRELERLCAWFGEDAPRQASVRALRLLDHPRCRALKMREPCDLMDEMNAYDGELMAALVRVIAVDALTMWAAREAIEPAQHRRLLAELLG